MDGGAELFGGAFELMLGLSTDNKGKVNPIGCLFSLLILVGIGYGIYYFSTKENKVAQTNKECGMLITKLKNNEVIVLLNGEKVIRKVSDDLYLNSVVEQDICFIKK